MMSLYKMINILFVNNGPILDQNGHNSVFMELVSSIKKYDVTSGRKLNIHIASFNWTLKDINNRYAIDKLLDSYEISDITAIHSHRIFNSNKFILLILNTLINIWRLLVYIVKYKVDKVVAYGHTGAIYGITAKIIFRRNMFFYWLGDMKSEILYFSDRIIDRLRAKIYAILEFFGIIFSNHIFCVSELAYKKMCVMRTPQNVTLIPNPVNTEIFNWDYKGYLRMKKTLSIQGRFVIVYSGTTRKYQKISRMIEFFRYVVKYDPKAFFLFLTPDPHIRIRNCFSSLGITEENYLVTNIDQKNLAKFLCIGNIGLLLRDNSLVNKMAFPTKFAEYLACGVPVLISRSLGDQAKIIRQNSIGEVMENTDSNTELDRAAKIIVRKYKKNMKIRRKCSDYANSCLAWSVFVPRIYYELL